MGWINKLMSSAFAFFKGEEAQEIPLLPWTLGCDFEFLLDEQWVSGDAFLAGVGIDPDEKIYFAYEPVKEPRDVCLIQANQGKSVVKMIRAGLWRWCWEAEKQVQS